MLGHLLGRGVISPKRLHDLMQRQPLTIVDVNPGQSWRAARLTGAINLDPTGFVATDLPADKDSMLVFYCSNVFCRKAPQAARRATGMGDRNVQVLRAGISGWIGAGLPTESGDAD
jgi:rhodanese-related sulfurtransferase